MNKVGSFSERLSDLRTQKGLSKTALARAVGVSTTCVWNWEEGNTHPRPAALSRIASVLSSSEAFLERGVTIAASSPEPDIHSSKMSSERPLVSEVIHRAREDIAAAAGLKYDQVRVVLEYGA